jgi:hypothetical protein
LEIIEGDQPNCTGTTPWGVATGWARGKANQRAPVFSSFLQRPSFVKRISFQIGLTEGTNDEMGEPSDESADPHREVRNV